MLQIIIIHEPHAVQISEVRDLDAQCSLSTFDEDKKCIDLSVLTPHVGETIMVTHFIKENECTRLDYEHEKVLTKVGTDDNGFMYVQYN